MTRWHWALALTLVALAVGLTWADVASATDATLPACAPGHTCSYTDVNGNTVIFTGAAPVGTVAASSPAPTTAPPTSAAAKAMTAKTWCELITRGATRTCHNSRGDTFTVDGGAPTTVADPPAAADGPPAAQESGSSNPLGHIGGAGIAVLIFGWAALRSRGKSF